MKRLAITVLFTMAYVQPCIAHISALQTPQIDIATMVERHSLIVSGTVINTELLPSRKDRDSAHKIKHLSSRVTVQINVTHKGKLKPGERIVFDYASHLDQGEGKTPTPLKGAYQTGDNQLLFLFHRPTENSPKNLAEIQNINRQLQKKTKKPHSVHFSMLFLPYQYQEAKHRKLAQYFKAPYMGFTNDDPFIVENTIALFLKRKDLHSSHIKHVEAFVNKHFDTDDRRQSNRTYKLAHLLPDKHIKELILLDMKTGDVFLSQLQHLAKLNLPLLLNDIEKILASQAPLKVKQNALKVIEYRLAHKARHKVEVHRAYRVLLKQLLPLKQQSQSKSQQADNYISWKGNPDVADIAAAALEVLKKRQHTFKIPEKQIPKLFQAHKYPWLREATTDILARNCGRNGIRYLWQLLGKTKTTKEIKKITKALAWHNDEARGQSEFADLPWQSLQNCYEHWPQGFESFDRYITKIALWTRHKQTAALYRSIWLKTGALPAFYIMGRIGDEHTETILFTQSKSKDLNISSLAILLLSEHGKSPKITSRIKTYLEDDSLPYRNLNVLYEAVLLSLAHSLREAQASERSKIILSVPNYSSATYEQMKITVNKRYAGSDDRLKNRFRKLQSRAGQKDLLATSRRLDLYTSK